jgi:hypothetical protein
MIRTEIQPEPIAPKKTSACLGQEPKFDCLTSRSFPSELGGLGSSVDAL